MYFVLLVSLESHEMEYGWDSHELPWDGTEKSVP